MKKIILFFAFLFLPLQANASKLKLLAVFGQELDPILIKIGDVSQNSKEVLKILAQDYFEERQEKVAAGYYQVNEKNWLENLKNQEINLAVICKKQDAVFLEKHQLKYEEIFIRNSNKCYAIYDSKPRALMFGFIVYLKSIRAQNIATAFSKMP